MANTWFVDRNGDESGPFTGAQLRTMAAKGEVRPTDLVRREDATDWRLASTIKGLFEPVEPPPPKAAAAKPTARVPAAEKPAVSARAKKERSQKTLVLLLSGAAGLLFVCCGGGTVLGILGQQLGEQVRKELAEADAQWDSGQRGQAAAIYRERRDLSMIDASRRAVIYGRLIDHAFESGRAAEGQALLTEAEKKGVMPVVAHADAKAAVEVAQAQKAKAEAERQERERQKSEEQAKAVARSKAQEKAQAEEEANTLQVSKGTFSGSFDLRVLVPDEITVSDPTLTFGIINFKLHWKRAIGRPRDPWHYSAYDKDGVKLDGGAVVLPDSIELGQKVKARIILGGDNVKEVTRVDIHQ